MDDDLFFQDLNAPLSNSSSTLSAKDSLDISSTMSNDSIETLHFFVSCTNIDGNLLPSNLSRSAAQNIVRGAFSMFTQATSASPRIKAPSDVVVKVSISEEIPLDNMKVTPAPVNMPLPRTNSRKNMLLRANSKRLTSEEPTSNEDKSILFPAETYWSEHRKSRNPQFSVGFSIGCHTSTVSKSGVAPIDRQVHIFVLIPEDSSNTKTQLFGYATTSFQEMFAVAQSGEYAQKLTLPVHSSIYDGATVIIKFANSSKVHLGHPILQPLNPIKRCFLFYPLLYEESQLEMQSAQAKLVVEEVHEVDATINIPLQILRVADAELRTRCSQWRSRYNYNRKIKRQFKNDFEALDFNHDVFKIQVICGQELGQQLENAKSRNTITSKLNAGGRKLIPNRLSAFQSNQAITKLKSKATSKWASNITFSDVYDSDDSMSDRGMATSSDAGIMVNLHPYALIKFVAKEGREWLVGRTNTEYLTKNPVWSTNQNLSAYSQSHPNRRTSPSSYVSATFPSYVSVSPLNFMKEFTFFQPHEDDLCGFLRLEIYSENPSSLSNSNGPSNYTGSPYMYPGSAQQSSNTDELIGEILLPLESIREALASEDACVTNDNEGELIADENSASQLSVKRLFLVDWFDVRSPTTDEICGQVQLRISVLLANALDESSKCLKLTAPPEADIPGFSQAVLAKMPLMFLYPHVLHLEQQLAAIAEMILQCELRQKSKVTFKSSQQKKHLDVQALPTNLHVSYFRIMRKFSSSMAKNRLMHASSWSSSGSKSVDDLLGLQDNEDNSSTDDAYIRSLMERAASAETHATTTCGAPTAHVLGHNEAGLREMDIEIQKFETLAEKCDPNIDSSNAQRGNLLEYLVVEEIADDHQYKELSGKTEFYEEQGNDGDEVLLDTGEQESDASGSNSSSIDVEEIETTDDEIDSMILPNAMELSAVQNEINDILVDIEQPKEQSKDKKVKKYSKLAKMAMVGAKKKAAGASKKIGRKKKRRSSARKLLLNGEAGKSGLSSTHKAKSYPQFRLELDEKDESKNGVDSKYSLNYMIQIVCRLEMLKSQYYMRKTVTVAQSASALVACFLSELELGLLEKNELWLLQIAEVGFLAGWESLISSHGNELCMLSDAWVAVKCMESFSFQLHNAGEITNYSVSICSRGDFGYTINVQLPSILWDMLPTKLRGNEGQKSSKLIAVTSVLFTQGINEMQSLANMVGHSGVSVQTRINSSSYKVLTSYYEKMQEAGLETADSSVGAHIDEILRNLRLSVEQENSSSKNTIILLHAADAVRSLHGGRITFCKSGKDRTAMSCTLEQARLVVQRKRQVIEEISASGAAGTISGGLTSGLSGITGINTGLSNSKWDKGIGPLEELKDVANILREFGVRMEIAKKNIGRYKYSFNAFQRKCLPEIYRPPMNTIQDIVTSVTARDS